MKAGPATVVATVIACLALPASLQAAPRSEAAAVSTDDLPMTPDFASLVTSYRNCVLLHVDKAPLGDHAEMATKAISACALSRQEVQSQLLADIETQHPRIAPAVATRTAQGGMAALDPIIEQAAIERAHDRYARIMD